MSNEGVVISPRDPMNLASCNITAAEGSLALRRLVSCNQTSFTQGVRFVNISVLTTSEGSPAAVSALAGMNSTHFSQTISQLIKYVSSQRGVTT